MQVSLLLHPANVASKEKPSCLYVGTLLVLLISYLCVSALLLMSQRLQAEKIACVCMSALCLCPKDNRLSVCVSVCVCVSVLRGLHPKENRLSGFACVCVCVCQCFVAYILKRTG